jgi:hypothetical protein
MANRTNVGTRSSPPNSKALSMCVCVVTFVPKTTGAQVIPVRVGVHRLLYTHPKCDLPVP